MIDRKTGVRFLSTFGAHRMFGEVWHAKDYDIPRVPIRSGDIVVDIGANQGAYTCYAAFQKARVFSFEPFSEMFRVLEYNLNINHLRAGVFPFQVALGVGNGDTELFISSKLGGMMNTTQATFVEAEKMKVEKRITVPQLTLPHVLEILIREPVRIIKLDCEGSELPILGMLGREHLARVDAFVMEYHPGAYAVSDLLNLILKWGTHQVSFAEDTFTPRNILRAVSNKVLASV